ncbi:MAG: gliding motility-associated C-terminal domain-containing protein [Balneolales bacterium]
MLKKRLYILFFGVLLFSVTGELNAQAIDDVGPIPHALNFTNDDSISVAISGEMISTNTLRDHIYIYGSQSGLRLQDKLVADRDEDAQIAWVKDFNFKPGELISVTIKEVCDSDDDDEECDEEKDFHLNPYQWQFSVRPESGTGEFKRRVQLDLPAASQPSSVFATDLNDDDFIDLAVLNGDNGVVSIFFNRESNMGLGFDNEPVNIFPPENSATLTGYQGEQRTSSLANYQHISGGDLRGNGQLSLIVTSKSTDEILIYHVEKEGKGTEDDEEEGEEDEYVDQNEKEFVYEKQIIKIAGESPIMSEVADFDNDGKMDIAVLASGSGGVEIFNNEDIINKDTGEIIIPEDINSTSYPVGSDPVSLITRNFNEDGDNKDGFIDIAVASRGQNHIDFLENDKEGGFKVAVSTGLTFSPGPITAGNFLGTDGGEPGDNFVELAVGSGNTNRVAIYIFDTSNGTFSQSRIVNSAAPTVYLSSGNFEGGTAHDLITVNHGHDSIELYPNQDNDEYASAVSITPDPPTDLPFGVGFALADFAQNGSMDIAVINPGSDKITILYNEGGTRNPTNPGSEVSAFPNPFTPNYDGYNDRTSFDFGDIKLANPVLEIFNFEGRRIKTIRNLDGTKLYWDGLDNNGREQQPGVYIYVIKDGSKALGSGVVTLAR